MKADPTLISRHSLTVYVAPSSLAREVVMSAQSSRIAIWAASCALSAALLAAAPAAARAQQKSEDRPAPDARQSARPAPPPPESSDRTTLAADVAGKREVLAESERLLLAPPAEDLEAYADFLRRPKTGLVRLLPREVFEDKLAIRGGGAYYSFTRLTHEYGHGSDIELSNDQLSTGFAGANYGLLVDLGDVPLEEVTRETYGVRQLDEHRPPSQLAKAREEQRRSMEGFEAAGFRYEDRVPARLDNTYALRSIDYDTSDVLVAFRVVRKESDGSVVLLWKLLKQYSKPKLARDSGAQ